MADIDIIGLSSLIGSFAALVVAIVALYNIKQNSKQLRFIEKQALFQRSSIYPLIQIKDVSVFQNKVHLDLNNKGDGPAFFIGILSDFTPLKRSADYFDFVDLYEFKNNSKSKVIPNKNVTFLKDENGESKLYDKEEKVFEKDVLFYYEYINKSYGIGKYFPFSDLKNILIENGIQHCRISLDMVYKDITEENIEIEPLYELICDLNKHQSLEEMVKENIQFKQRALYLEKDLGFVLWNNYKNMKTKRAFLEDPLKKYNLY